MIEVSVAERRLDRFVPIVGRESFDVANALGEEIRTRLAGRTVWNVNSTKAGGGVAEMLPSLLGYSRGLGIDARWLVIDGPPEFFRITKRLHHALHGSSGDGSPLLAGEPRTAYEATTRMNGANAARLVRPGDIVLLHDPQTAGLAADLVGAGAVVVWRCHIGADTSNAEVETGWEFLAPYLRCVPAFVFSRHAYVPEYCDHGKTTIITPSIDAFSAKNQELAPAAVYAILSQAGLVRGLNGAGAPAFTRDDGSPGRVRRRADVIAAGHRPRPDTQLVVQVSRWDPLKDPVGVMHGFAHLVAAGAPENAELMLAGPCVNAVADDPEGKAVFEDVVRTWRNLPDATRQRIHLALLPMDDVEENAAIVNALQRHAAIVVQKSLREGFGLTVTEAMWKARPIVATAVGGIQDQIDDGVHGLLIQRPTDSDAFAAALRRLLRHPEAAGRMGANARERVRRQFLGLHHLAGYANLFSRLLDAGPGIAPSVGA